MLDLKLKGRWVVYIRLWLNCTMYRYSYGLIETVARVDVLTVDIAAFFLLQSSGRSIFVYIMATSSTESKDDPGGIKIALLQRTTWKSNST